MTTNQAGRDRPSELEPQAQTPENQKKFAFSSKFPNQKFLTIVKGFKMPP